MLYLTTPLLAALLPLAFAQEPAPEETEPVIEEAEETPPPSPIAGSILLTEARLIDGTGAPPREDVAILLIDGRIAAIESAPGPMVAETEYALDGATVIPGLIDSHTHVTLAPGQYLPAAELDVDAILKAQLRSYLAAGVTTVLDAVAYDSEMDRVQGWLADGAAGPRVLALGTPASMPGSYGPAVLPDIPVQSTPDEVRAHVTAQAQRDVVGLKLLVEDGIVSPIWPLPEGEWLDAVVETAAEHDLPLFAHAMTPDETAAALQAKPRAMIHGMDDVDDQVIADLVAAGTYVVPTIYISDGTMVTYEPERLDDPLLRELVPAALQENAADEELLLDSFLAIGAVAMQGAPGWLVRFLSKRGMKSDKFARKLLGQRLEAAAAMYEAGVPLVVGSDAPGWPVMLHLFHGYGTIREIELLEQAGLPPEELLLAATRRPAEMLRVDDEIGTLEVGKAADLVVLNADPLQGAAAYRDVRYVARAGDMRTPEEWLAAE